MSEVPRSPRSLKLFFLVPVFFLASCGASSHASIKEISLSGPPVVGTVVAMTVKVVSNQDEPAFRLTAYLPEGVRLIEGDLTWETSFAASQQVAHNFVLCVVYPGDWRIIVIAEALPQGRDT